MDDFKFNLSLQSYQIAAAAPAAALAVPATAAVDCNVARTATNPPANNSAPVVATPAISAVFCPLFGGTGVVSTTGGGGVVVPTDAEAVVVEYKAAAVVVVPTDDGAVVVVTEGGAEGGKVGEGEGVGAGVGYTCPRSFWHV